MLFGAPQKLAKISQFSVTIVRSAIKHVTEFQDLVAIFDEHLSWNGHVFITSLRKSFFKKAIQTDRRVVILGRACHYITLLFNKL